MEDEQVKELEIDEQTQEEESSGVIWDSEIEGLKTRDELQGDWFTPPIGATKLKFLSEGRKETRQYDDGEKEVVVFDVEILSSPGKSDYGEGEEMVWSVTKGKTEVSLFGQIAKLGAYRGSLEGQEITLIRQGEGNDTQYSVVESAEISLDEVRE